MDKGENKKKYRDAGIMDNLGDDYFMLGGSGSYFCESRDPMVENLTRLQSARQKLDQQFYEDKLKENTKSLQKHIQSAGLFQNA